MSPWHHLLCAYDCVWQQMAKRKMRNNVAMSIFGICVLCTNPGLFNDSRYWGPGRKIRTNRADYLFWAAKSIKINHENYFPCRCHHSLPYLRSASVWQQFVCVSNDDLLKNYKVSTDDARNLFHNWFIVFNLMVENGRVSRLETQEWNARRDMTDFTMDLNLVQSNAKVRLGCRPNVVQLDSGSRREKGTHTLMFGVFDHLIRHTKSSSLCLSPAFSAIFISTVLLLTVPADG